MPVPESLIFVAILLFVRVGQLLLIAGSVRSKNAVGTCVRLLMDLAVATLALWAIGGAFVPAMRLGEDSYITFSHLLGIGSSSWIVFTQLPFILIATAAVHGATAERTRMLPVLITGGAIAILLPILTQISDRIDLPATGIGIAATMGGAAAWVGAILAGPRKGKFNRDLSVNFVPGHNIVLQLVGVMVLIVALTMVSGDVGSTLIACSSALLAGAAVGRIKFGKIDTGLMIASALGGLVAGATGIGPTWVAFLVGGVVGVVVPFAVMILETRFRIDDVIGAVPTHWLGGFIGMLVAAVVQLGYIAFTDATWTWWVLLWVCMPTIATVVGAAIGLGAFFGCKSMNQVRLTEGAEFDGTDLSELDVNAYPDFQQTMIKSYHLREL